jgi:hypothetical protein
MGAVLAKLQGGREGFPPWVVLPRTIGNTGLSVSHGQSAGYLGGKLEPLVFSPESQSNSPDLAGAEVTCDQLSENEGAFEPRSPRQRLNSRARVAFDLADESPRTRESYGLNSFGQKCLLARRLVEHGVRFVTVNMFDSVFNRITWDCHANGGELNSTLDDYRRVLCPMLDRALTTLLTDLRERGLLETTLVTCMGEFGRTPKINNRGGRDHWPGVWSALFAGGSVRGGQVLGASDAHGEAPADRPVSPAEIVATVYQSLGLDPAMRLPRGSLALPLTDAAPIHELFA